MSNTQKQETSASSPLEEGSEAFRPVELQFETKDSRYFHVEWTEKGDDIVYHFWPPGDDGEFVIGFHRYLEDAFIRVLPPGQRVQADYTNIKEATVQHAHGVAAVPKKDAHREIVIPRENYYVRVVDGLKNPLSNLFLKERVFTVLEEEIKDHVS